MKIQEKLMSLFFTEKEELMREEMVYSGEKTQTVIVFEFNGGSNLYIHFTGTFTKSVKGSKKVDFKNEVTFEWKDIILDKK